MEELREIGGIPVHFVRKQVKNLSLRVKPDGSVWVTLPPAMPLSRAEAFLRQKWDWLQKKLRQRTAAAALPPVRLVSGESLPLWGETLALTVEEGPGSSREAVRQAGVLTIRCRPGDSFDTRREILFRFYQAEVRRQLLALIPECGQAVGRRAAGWSIRPMKSRWGSCTVKTGKIRISTLLAAYPPGCLKSVVIHELCHLLVSGHSPRFYAEMDRAWPAWRQWDPLLKRPEPVLRQLFIPS